MEQQNLKVDTNTRTINLLIDQHTTEERCESYKTCQQIESCKIRVHRMGRERNANI